jgi:hypothetical protein
MRDKILGNACCCSSGTPDAGKISFDWYQMLLSSFSDKVGLSWPTV